MNDDVRRALKLLAQYPLALIGPFLVPSWLFVLLDYYADQRAGGTHLSELLVLFACYCAVAYLAQAFVCRAICDVLEVGAPKRQEDYRLSMHPSSFKLAAGLLCRFLLWMIVALVIALIAKRLLVTTIPAYRKQQLGGQDPYHVVSKVTVLCVTALIAKYSFAMPYFAFSRGALQRPLAVSVERSKPFLSQLIFFSLSVVVLSLGVSELFRGLAARASLPPHNKLLFDMLRDTLQSPLNSLWIVTVTLLAHQDWVVFSTTDQEAVFQPSTSTSLG